MIRRIEISNYRSIGPDAVLELGRLTALVGPNGSGKSNFARALRFVSESLRIGLPAAIKREHGITAVRRWSSGRPLDVRLKIDVSLDEGRGGSYQIELGGAKDADYRVKREVVTQFSMARDFLGFDALGSSFTVEEGEWTAGPTDLRPKIDPTGLALPAIAGDSRFQALADVLRGATIYTIFPDTLKRPQTPDPSKPMDEHGGNWCSILESLEGEASFRDLEAALGQLTGDIDALRVRQVGGFLVAEFRHGTVRGKKNREKWFEAAQESDGTLRVAGILTALMQVPPPSLIGIEEPELTVNPGAIPLLFDFLKEASDRSQVLLTTHSPDLLACLDVEDVRVVEKRDGMTSVSRMHASQRDVVRERLLSIGDVMRMEGLRQENIPQQQVGVGN